MTRREMRVRAKAKRAKPIGGLILDVGKSTPIKVRIGGHVYSMDAYVENMDYRSDVRETTQWEDTTRTYAPTGLAHATVTLRSSGPVTRTA